MQAGTVDVDVFFFSQMPVHTLGRPLFLPSMRVATADGKAFIMLRVLYLGALMLCAASCRRDDQPANPQGYQPPPVNTASFTLFREESVVKLDEQARTVLRDILATKPVVERSRGLKTAPDAAFVVDGQTYLLFGGAIRQDRPNSQARSYWKHEAFSRMNAVFAARKWERSEEVAKAMVEAFAQEK